MSESIWEEEAPVQVTKIKPCWSVQVEDVYEYIAPLVLIIAIMYLIALGSNV